MRTHRSPLALYKAQLALFQRTKQSIEAGHLAIALGGREDYDQLTSGMLPPSRTKGHFARRASGRRAPGGSPLLPINQQSGRLRRSIRLTKANVPGTKQAFHVGPSASAGPSIFVLLPSGTYKMVARGADAVIEQRFRARNKALIDHIRLQQRK